MSPSSASTQTLLQAIRQCLRLYYHADKWDKIYPLAHKVIELFVKKANEDVRFAHCQISLNCQAHSFASRLALKHLVLCWMWCEKQNYSTRHTLDVLLATLFSHLAVYTQTNLKAQKKPLDAQAKRQWQGRFKAALTVLARAKAPRRPYLLLLKELNTAHATKPSDYSLAVAAIKASFKVAWPLALTPSKMGTMAALGHAYLLSNSLERSVLTQLSQCFAQPITGTQLVKNGQAIGYYVGHLKSHPGRALVLLTGSKHTTFDTVRLMHVPDSPPVPVTDIDDSVLALCDEAHHPEQTRTPACFTEPKLKAHFATLNQKAFVELPELLDVCDDIPHIGAYALKYASTLCREPIPITKPEHALKYIGVARAEYLVKSALLQQLIAQKLGYQALPWQGLIEFISKAKDAFSQTLSAFECEKLGYFALLGLYTALHAKPSASHPLVALLADKLESAPLFEQVNAELPLSREAKQILTGIFSPSQGVSLALSVRLLYGLACHVFALPISEASRQNMYKISHSAQIDFATLCQSQVVLHYAPQCAILR